MEDEAGLSADVDIDSGVGAEAPVADAAPEQSSAGGFNTPYEAFRHLPDFNGRDDLEIARDLYKSYQGYQEAQRQLQQYQQVVPYAQEYLKNQQAFEQWRQAQNQPPKQEETPKWWNPPAVDESYKHYIIRDEQGREVIDPNAPLHAQEALRKYQDYTANFARKFVTDPEGTLKPLIEQVASQKAKELVEAQFGQYQTKTFVQGLEQSNADWLYDRQGNVTPEGRAIQAYIEEGKKLGINDPNACWRFATGMLQRDLLMSMRQQPAPPAYQPPPQQFAPPAPAPQPPAQPAPNPQIEFLRKRATRTTNRSGGTTEPRAPRQRMSMEDRLALQFSRDGLTE